MSKMAPMVGKEITERYFLGQFDNLCSDPLFHVRKVTFHCVCRFVLNSFIFKFGFRDVLYSHRISYFVGLCWKFW